MTLDKQSTPDAAAADSLATNANLAQAGAELRAYMRKTTNQTIIFLVVTQTAISSFAWAFIFCRLGII